jgi:hypothetical protein
MELTAMDLKPNHQRKFCTSDELPISIPGGVNVRDQAIYLAKKFRDVLLILNQIHSIKKIDF